MFTYSVANDTAAGAVNADRLTDEINTAACLNNFTGIQVVGDQLRILGDLADGHPMSDLDSVIHAHVAISLDDNKAAKCQAIDDRTDAIIADGFTFDGNAFSLSGEAQTNWLGLCVLQSALTWPVAITTGHNAQYMLPLTSLGAFIATGMGTIKSAVDSGRTLKVAAMTAANQADLDAVVDNR